MPKVQFPVVEIEGPAADVTEVVAKRPHESWAEEKGFLPAFSGVSRARTNGLENPKHWKYAAAKASRGWVIGFEITEEEFDAAVNEAASVAIG